MAEAGFLVVAGRGGGPTQDVDTAWRIGDLGSVTHEAAPPSRRAFLRQSLIAGSVASASALAVFLARGRPPAQRPPAPPPTPTPPTPTPPGPTPPEAGRPRLPAEQRQTLCAVQERLLPGEPGSPGAGDVHAADYYEGVLGDPRAPVDDIQAVTEGLAGIERLSREHHGQGFALLPAAAQDAVLRLLGGDTDGAEQLGVLLIFTLEALLSDPVYGGNHDQQGWRWLGLAPAGPRPAAPWYAAASAAAAAVKP